VGVAGATHIPEERNPIHVVAHSFVESRRIAYPRRKQARPKLRLQWLAERIVLRQRQGGDEFT
jgi:hypothetical protein